MSKDTETQLAERPTAAAPLLPRGQAPEWVMIGRVGRWEGHPDGPEVITAARLASALDHFERHYEANDADLPIDYHHGSVFAAARGGPPAPAAGWIRQMELRAEGTQLWARVVWTADAARDVAAGRFRYVSPVLRFGAPDRVTGRPVPMLVHSLALTNTPFLTELQALNEQSAGQAPEQPFTQGGDAMPILDQMAAALNRPAGEVRQALRLHSAQDRDVAAALLEQSARLEQLEAQAAGTAAVRGALGLAAGAGEDVVLNAIGALQQTRRDTEAEQLVDGAVRQGRITPAQRDFFLRCAREDLPGTRLCLNSLAPLVSTPLAGGPAHAGRRRGLTDAETCLCRQLGLSAEAFLDAADEGRL